MSEPLTTEAKAKILDSIIAEHGYHAQVLTQQLVSEEICRCDQSVGYTCGECIADAVLRRVAGVARLYERGC